MNHAKLEWYVLAFILLIVAVVFWQIYAVMTPAGIASGGALENAAAYPRGLAIILGILVILRSVAKIIESKKQEVSESETSISWYSMRTSILLLVVFTLYLLGLGKLGYHIMTPIFLIIILFLVGEKNWLKILLFSVICSLSIAFVFEVLLKIVLPGGVFRINIPW